MNSQKRLEYVQKIFNPGNHGLNGIATLSKENFARVMIESINKAINSNESAVKEKHVRKLLIGSYQAESGAFFWQHLPIIKLKENQVVSWKFCHVLHKMLRDGHREVLVSSYERRKILIDCGNMWRHVQDGYGQMIYKYCTLLYNRMKFMVRNPDFPSDLKVSDEQLAQMYQNNASKFFDFACEIFDSLDDILRLQELVLVTLDLKKYNSMSSAGQCHLAPLVMCIQDSGLLYDYSVKVLFKLHGDLDTSFLEGHRDRFLCQHKALRKFYSNASNLQFFKTLIQIPHLPERAPNFLVASELKQHVTPQVLIISNPDNASDATQSTSPTDDNNVLVDVFDDSASTMAPSSVGANEDSVDGFLVDHLDAFAATAHSSLDSNLMSSRNSELANRVQELESLLNKLRMDLAEERENNASTMQSMTLELEELKSKYDILASNTETEIKRLKNELSNARGQAAMAKGALSKAQEACDRAQHDSEISREAMKKLVKDKSDLKTECDILRNQQQPPPIKSVAVANPVQVFDTSKLDKRIQELELQLKQSNQLLSERDKQYREVVEEKNELDKTRKRLENEQSDLFTGELNETDKIIKEATRRIEELAEKSRQVESGVALQVNEKISDVCSNLMKAVRNLIVQSRFLQKEVVANSNGANQSNASEFYKQNSSWTEGLLSAAYVVAMAAKSLVDSADRSMSGSGKYSELAAAAHEIAAATTQLVVASRVKANKDSEKLKTLLSASKQVSQCTSNIVDTARICGQLMDQEVDKIDLSKLSLHQTKQMEIETQVKLLELEMEVSKARIKLGLLRKQHYEQEDALAAPPSTTTAVKN